MTAAGIIPACMPPMIEIPLEAIIFSVLLTIVFLLWARKGPNIHIKAPENNSNLPTVTIRR
jgi:hypothetical protein